MPFKKGDRGNPHGRPKGSENKDKKELRELITLFIERNYDKFEKKILETEGQQFVNNILNLLEYSLGKLQRTEHSGQIKSDDPLNDMTFEQAYLLKYGHRPKDK